MQLTYHTDYALRLLIYLAARPGKTVTTREVAEHYHISRNHLVKVAKSLTQAGWLTASRGVGGGLTLAKHTLDVTVGEIVRHTENSDLVECFQPRTSTCPLQTGCLLKPLLYEARSAFFAVLDVRTIRELIMTSASQSAPSRSIKRIRPPSAPHRKNS